MQALEKVGFVPTLNNKVFEKVEAYNKGLIKQTINLKNLILIKISPPQLYREISVKVEFQIEN